MRFFRLKNFETFQHYKDRNPVWIKLHRALLDDYDFTHLPDAMKAHLMLIWLLGSQMDGRIPDDPAFIGARIGAKKPPDLRSLSEAGWLIPEPIPEPGADRPPDEEHERRLEQNASDLLADCEQDASNTLALARSQEERRKALQKLERRGERAKGNGIAHPLPNQTHRDLAEKLGLRCDYEWEKFCDHEWKPGKEPKDKARGFRNWLRKASEFAIRDGKVKDRPLDWGKVV